MFCGSLFLHPLEGELRAWPSGHFPRLGQGVVRLAGFHAGQLFLKVFPRRLEAQCRGHGLDGLVAVAFLEIDLGQGVEHAGRVLFQIDRLEAVVQGRVELPPAAGHSHATPL